MQERRTTPTKSKTTGLLALGAILAVTIAAGCDPEPAPEPDPMDPPAPAAEDPAAEPAPPDPEMEHSVTPLHPEGGSEVEGEALAMHEEDSVVLIIEVSGLPSEGEYAAHIHEGSCAEGGPVTVGLTSVAGGPDGQGSSTTVLGIDELDPAQPIFVQIHGEDGDPIACGDVVGHGN